jgi:A1 cistron-splicing factor AAR2
MCPASIPFVMIMALFVGFFFQTFFSNLESAGDEIDKGLVKRGLQFRDHLTKKFKWDFSVEPSECAPTIVDI